VRDRPLDRTWIYLYVTYICSVKSFFVESHCQGHRTAYGSYWQEYRGSYSNFEGFGCELLWEELEGNSGTVAVQAIACTDKVRTRRWRGWMALRVAVNRLAFQQANTHVCFEAKQDLFLKCIRATLRTDLAIIQRRLWMGCTNQEYHWCEEGLPSKTNGRPKTRFTGAFEALIRLSNESGTSESSLRVGDDSWIGWRGREHLGDALQMSQDRREDGEIGEGSSERTRESIAFFLWRTSYGATELT
jgi:hypothetical protein